MRLTTALFLGLLVTPVARAEIGPRGAALYLDFGAGRRPGIRLLDGARRVGPGLEFTTAIQAAEMTFARALDDAPAVTVGGWLFPRRAGEQMFLSRGLPEVGPIGERQFPPRERWVNFVLGTDQHGFLLGTVHGNGAMPFPHVTVSEVTIDAWSQLAVVKGEGCYQDFYI